MNKQLSRLLVNSLLSFTIVMVLYSILCSLSYSPGGFQGIYGNSDLLQVPVIARNLLYEHGHIRDWYFSQAPYFFPDILLTSIISLVVHNITLNILVVALVQTLYLVFIAGLLLKLITHYGIFLRYSISFTLIVFLLSTELVGHGPPVTLELFSTMTATAIHFGAFLVMLTSLYLFIQFANQQKRYLLFLFCILTVAGIASDILIIFYLMAPLILTVIFIWIFKFKSLEDCRKWLILLMLTLLIGYLIYRFAPLHYYRDSRLIHYQAGNVKAFMKVIIHFLKNSPAIGILWLFFIFLAPASLVQTYRQKDKPLFNNNIDWVNFVILWLVVMIIFCIPTFILMDFNLALANSNEPYPYMGLRHMAPVILFPVLIGVPLLLYKHTNLPDLLAKNYTFCALLFLIIVSSFINRPRLNWTNLSTYYPPGLACLDDHAQKLHLHAGLGNYWQARPFTYFNHSGIAVASVDDNFSPFLWVTSMQYFRRHDFDFIIAKSPTKIFDQDKIISQFGKPTSTFICPNNYEFYVYSKGLTAKPLPY